MTRGKQLIRRLSATHRDGYDTLLLVGGTVLGQGLTVLVSPLLTRLYSPEAFGELAVYGALLGALVVVASLRYEQAIPVADDEETAVNLVGLSLLLVLAMAVLCAITLLLYGSLVVQWTQSPGLARYLWLLPLGMVGAGAYQVLNNYAIRRKTFSRIAQTKVSQGLSQVIVQLGLGFASAGSLGLLLGDALGRISGSGTLAGLVWTQERTGLRRISFRRMMASARQYSRYPLISAWSALVNIAGAQLPILLVSSFFGGTVLGQFSLGVRTLQIPVGIIGQAVAQVFYARADQARREDRLAKVTLAVFEKLVALGLGPFMFFGAVAPWVFGLIFGDAWREAGVYSRWLSPWLFFVFVSSPLSRLVFVVDAQQGELYFQLGLLGTRVAAVVLGAMIGGPSAAIKLYGLVSASCWLLYNMWLMRISGNDFRTTCAVLFKHGRTVLMLFVPLGLLQLFEVHATLWTVVALAPPAVGILLGLLKGLKQGIA